MYPPWRSFYFFHFDWFLLWFGLTGGTRATEASNSSLIMKTRKISSPDYFQEFDFFSKIDKSSVKSSPLGGVFTCIVFIIVFLLFIQEFVWFTQVEFNEYVSVDRSGNTIMDVTLDVAFPNVRCTGMASRLRMAYFYYSNLQISCLVAKRRLASNIRTYIYFEWVITVLWVRVCEENVSWRLSILILLSRCCMVQAMRTRTRMLSLWRCVWFFLPHGSPCLFRATFLSLCEGQRRKFRVPIYDVY